MLSISVSIVFRAEDNKSLLPVVVEEKGALQIVVYFGVGCIAEKL